MQSETSSTVTDYSIHYSCPLTEEETHYLIIWNILICIIIFVSKYYLGPFCCAPHQNELPDLSPAKHSHILLLQHDITLFEACLLYWYYYVRYITAAVRIRNIEIPNAMYVFEYMFAASSGSRFKRKHIYVIYNSLTSYK